MFAITVTPEALGLIRMGRKRSIARLFVMPTPDFGSPIQIQDADTPRHIDAAATRFVVTTIALLTQADSTRAGFLYLHKFQESLMDSPHITPETIVSIIEFCCEGDV